MRRELLIVAGLAACAACVWAAGAREANAQVRMQSFSHPINLDPQGDNWLALKDGPSLGARRLMKLGPNALFTVIGREGKWLKVELRGTGQVGWVHSAYVGCCRTAPVY